MLSRLKEIFKNFFNKFGARHNKIFIIPTRYGLYFIAIVFVLFLISLSYGHSLAFTTTFVFVALVMTSAHFTNYNLAGIEIVAIHPPEEAFAGDDALFKITLRNTTKKHRFDLILKIGDLGESESFSLAPGTTTSHKLALTSLKRGEYQLKRLTIATSFPFGLFYAWKYWYEGQGFTVFPAPSKSKESLPAPFSNPKERGQSAGSPEHGAEEFFGHQNYDESMPLRSIDWKAYARGKGLLLKKFIEQSDVIYILKRQDYLRSNEPQSDDFVIEKMANLVLQADSTGSSYALVIGEESPRFGRGRGFRKENLKRLACHNKERQVIL